MEAPPGNPLLLQWLEEWRDESQAKNNVNSFSVYKKACESMRNCTMKFDHPSEAIGLKFVGDKIVKRLEERMERFCRDNGLPAPSRRQGRKRRSNASDVATPSDPVVSSPVTAKAKKDPKKYVPKPRTGGWAIILALQDSMEGDPHDKTGLTKDQLCDSAQPYCDSSFKVPKDTKSFYTAWATMKTLDDHGLVFNRGRPNRYFLSEDGWRLAEMLRKVKMGTKDVVIESPNQKRRRVEEENAAGRDSIPFKPDTQETTSRSNTTHSRASKPPSVSWQNNRTVVSAISSSTTLSGSGFRAPPSSNYIDLDSDDDIRSPPQSQEINLFPLDNSSQRLRIEPQPRKTSTPHLVPSSSSSVAIPDHPPFTPIVIPAGSFTVHLVLDNREVRSQKDRTYVQEQLAEHGVQPITQPLSLGDAFWIAKPTSLLNPTEYILPHLLERKRLDDLVSSIKDKRFHEQKFRLQRCGIPPQSITYLIEEYSQSEHQKINEADRILTAKAETLIINGFFVKTTQKMDDTIRYLARMTKSIISLYKDRPLYVLPTSHIDSRTYPSLQANLREKHPEKTFTIPSTTFAELTSKSGALSLRDLYLKMLMCTKGISGEKALEIQRVWPTPRAFVDSFESCRNEKEKERMVMEGLKGRVGRKYIAGALSKSVASVWGGVGKEVDVGGR